jgi:polyhydroxybutyrate depolymerase
VLIGGRRTAIGAGAVVAAIAIGAGAALVALSSPRPGGAARERPSAARLVTATASSASPSVSTPATADAGTVDPRTPAPASSGSRSAHGSAAPSGSGPPAGNPSPDQLLAGLGPIPSGWESAVHSLEIGGLVRQYVTVAPANVRSSVPVVVLMHGRNMTPGDMLRASGLAAPVGPAVLVVPAGWDRSWNAGDCCGLAYQHGVDDVRFISRVVTDVLAAYPYADASRVYAVGFSNGGRLAYQLACQLPGTFRGFIAAEAVPVESCPSMEPVDVTIIAQQSDPLLTITSGRPKTVGGFVEPYVDSSVASMVALDHCDATYTVAQFGSAVEKTWSCPRGVDVRYVLYPGGGHSWRPASATTPGATSFALQMMGRGPLSATGALAGHRVAASPSHSGA